MTDQDSEARLLALCDVSRETIGRLRAYEGLLKKWNPAINLVSRRTLDEVWTRHFLDSAQLFAQVDDPKGVWADLGAGGGFPGLVIAILALEKAPVLHVVLVESDQRKSTFLRTVARELSLPVTVLTGRIEDIAPIGAHIVSARALAPLPLLLDYGQRHLAPGGIALFPKGGTWKGELHEAAQQWKYEVETVPSLTEPSAILLKLKGITRV